MSAAEAPQVPAVNPLRRRYNTIALSAFFGGAAVAFVVLLLVGNSLLTAFALALPWGGLPQAFAWGAANAVAPGWVIQWRQRLISGNSGTLKSVGDRFSSILAISGDEPWKNPEARRRVRRSGALQLVGSVLFAAVLVLLAGPLNVLYAGMLARH